MFYSIFIPAFIALSIPLIMKRKKVSKLEEIFRVLLVVFMVTYFLNLLLPDGISYRAYDDTLAFSSGENIYYVLIRWLNDMSFVILPIAFFYKRKTFIRIASFILPIAFILMIAFEFKYIELVQLSDGSRYIGEGIMNLRFFSELEKDFFVNTIFRTIYFSIFMMLEGLIILYIILKNLDNLKFENKDELKRFILTTIGVFFLIMPIYAPQYLFRVFYTDGSHWSTFTIFKPMHIAWLIYLALEIFLLYRILRKLDNDEKYISVLTISFALFFQFHEIYTCFGEITTTRYPFQLCNIASGIILLSLLLRNERIFRFTLVVNTLGAIIACIMCDSSKSSIWYIMNVHYIVEHAKILIIPYLASLLGVFKPLDKKALKDVIITYSIYFLFIFLIGGFFRGIFEITGNDYFRNNYLFMFNKEATMDIVSFVGPLFDINTKIFGIFYVNLLEPIIYLAFLSLSIGMFYLIYYFQNRNKKNKS